MCLDSSSYNPDPPSSIQIRSVRACTIRKPGGMQCNAMNANSNECSCHNRKHKKTEYLTASPTFQSLRWKVREHCFSLNPHGVYDDLWMKIPEIKMNKLRSAICLVRESESKKEDRTKEEKEFIKLGITLDLFQLVFFNFFYCFANRLYGIANDIAVVGVCVLQMKQRLL